MVYISKIWFGQRPKEDIKMGVDCGANFFRARFFFSDTPIFYFWVWCKGNLEVALEKKC